MDLTLKQHAQYIHFDIYDNNVQIGKVSIEETRKEVWGLEIFPPFRNKGYGTAAVKKLLEEYGVKTITVEADNEPAIHIYKKLGFKIKEPLYYFMEQ